MVSINKYELSKAIVFLVQNKEIKNHEWVIGDLLIDVEGLKEDVEEALETREVKNLDDFDATISVFAYGCERKERRIKQRLDDGEEVLCTFSLAKIVLL